MVRLSSVAKILSFVRDWSFVDEEENTKDINNREIETVQKYKKWDGKKKKKSNFDVFEFYVLVAVWICKLLKTFFQKDSISIIARRKDRNPRQ